MNNVFGYSQNRDIWTFSHNVLGISIHPHEPVNRLPRSTFLMVLIK
jgi:hypothetical protein